MVENLIDDKVKALADTAKVIGHPSRIAILTLLINNSNQTCKDLTAQLPFSQSTVSMHLYRLRSVGLIEGTYYKSATIYSVNHSKIENFKKAMDAVFAKPKVEKQLSLF